MEDGETKTTTVFIGSVTAGRQRSFLVACSICGSGYYLAARTVREMRQDGRDPVCRTCRRPDPIQVTPKIRAWAEMTVTAMAPRDRELVAFALSGLHIPAKHDDLALAASAARR